MRLVYICAVAIILPSGSDILADMMFESQHSVRWTRREPIPRETWAAESAFSSPPDELTTTRSNVFTGKKKEDVLITHTLASPSRIREVLVSCIVKLIDTKVKEGRTCFI